MTVRRTLLSRFLILTSAMTQCSPCLVSPRKVKPIFFRINPARCGCRISLRSDSCPAVPQTSSAICTNHIIDFQGLIFNAPVRVRLLQPTRDAVVVMFYIDELRSQFNFSSESSKVVSENDLSSSLAEENWVQLTTVNEIKLIVSKCRMPGNAMNSRKDTRVLEPCTAKC